MTLPAPLNPNLDQPSQVADLFERTNDRSIINLVTPELQAAILDARSKSPDLFGLDERDLFWDLRRNNNTPSPTDNRLRLSFWLEYDRAQDGLRQMGMQNVFGGVCTKSYFYGTYIRRPDKLAWLLCPPVKYALKIEEALDFGLDRLREMLELPVRDEKGRLNVKLMELQAKIVAMLDQRSKGAVIQKNLNLNISSSEGNGPQQLAVVENMAQLDRKIKELELRERQSLNLTEPKGTIEVESTIVTEDAKNG